MRTIKGQVLSGVCLAASFLAACSSGAPREEAGTLELALQSQGSQGTWFGLRGTFSLNDPENLQVTTLESDSASVVTLQPRVGSYQLELCAQGSTNPVCQTNPAYGLYRLQCTNAMIPAPQCLQLGFALNATLVTDAVLTTPNPQPVSIVANQTTTAAFSFTVPGEGNVVFARGSLNVGVNVTEGFADGQACSTAVQCQSKVCTNGVCIPATCNDGVQNGSETAPDCGGTCTACPSCMDGIQNGNETGPDCGGNCVPCGSVLCGTQMCLPGQTCDPATGQCVGGNGTPCMSSAQCSGNQQCVNGVCTSTGVSCGTQMCAPGQTCDPATGQCVGGGNLCGGLMCAPGQVCDPATGQCVGGGGTACMSNAECGGGQVCVNGVCTSVGGTGSACMSDSQCSNGLTCVNGVCGSAGVMCGGQMCEPGKTCDALGQCVCGGHVCPLGRACEMGQCAGTCGACPLGLSCDPTTLQCVNSNHSFCSTGAECFLNICNNDGLCFCTSDSHCSIGATCIDQMCICSGMNCP